MRRPLLLTIAVLAGIAYALLTPPFETPDETFHFWRPIVIAGGQLLPQKHLEPDAGTVPVGAKTLVYVMQTMQSSGKYTRDQMKFAFRIPAEAGNPKVVRFPSWYTPVAYLPQTVAAACVRWLDVRPLVTFYAGRLANLAVALLLVAMAMRIAPRHDLAAGAVLLLPMTLAQFASWSADALTVGLAILLTAMLLEDRVSWQSAVVAFLLALCKPAYFLIALLAIPARGRRTWKAAIVASSAAGTLLAFGYARLGYYVQRMGMPIDAATQLRCLVHDPARFLRAVASNLAQNGGLYAEQTVGHLGSVGQLDLPAAIVVLELLVLAGCAVAGGAVRGRQRAMSIAVVLLTAGGIFLSQYLIWSIACGEVIEGVQGRYFLPVLPLAMIACAWVDPPRRFGTAVVAAAAAVSNGFAVVRLARHFWAW